MSSPNHPLVQAILDTGAALAEAVTAEMALEDARHTVKMAAIERIIKSGDNPLTGKPHSFSSAEATVSGDAEYSRHLSALRDAAAVRIFARAKYDAALAAARIDPAILA